MRSFLVVVIAACSHPVVFHDGRADPSMARAAEASLDTNAVDRLLVTAAAEHSTAVVIAQDGRIVVERYRDGYDGAPVMAMSASKSIVAIAAGLAINDGKLALDTPVASLLPEWHDDGKRAITVRHLLSQTSGLEQSRAQFRDGETIVAHSAAARVVFAPGSHWQYNNGGVDLLAAVIERAVGEPFDRYVERALFAKLDIRGASWLKDRAGTARGAGELMIRPVDLIKIGELMLDQGCWHDQPVVPPEWVTAMVTQSQPFHADYGLLWWRDGEFASVLDASVLDGWHAAGVPATTIAQARSQLGRPFATPEVYRRALAASLGPSAFEELDAIAKRNNHMGLEDRVEIDRSVVGFSARGWLGQYLVVVPSKRIVAVRMRAETRADHSGQAEEDEDHAFIAQVDAL